ncbi:MAG: response regulator transcription factor [Chloroflexota bacterium]
MSQVIRVLLADDHPALRVGLRLLLEQAPDIQVVGEAGEGEEALAQIETSQPEVAVLDCLLPGMAGVEVAAEVQRRGLPTRILALSAYRDEKYVQGMITAGAVGYLVKEEAPGVIVAAVRAAARGERLWTGEQIARARHWQEEVKERWERLTEREREVLLVVAVGHSNKQIAHEMGISEKTVEYHVTNILGKLGVGSRSEAIVWVKNSGLSVGQPDPREIPR